MTAAARRVLEDCRGALAELSDGVHGPTWRRRWITAAVLLRAVGHVLHKVDSNQSPLHERAINDAWSLLQSSRPEPKIFWGFIDEERNNILKQYELAAGQGATVRIGASPEVTYNYVMNTGPFAGVDQRELIFRAILWWEEYLKKIDLVVDKG